MADASDICVAGTGTFAAEVVEFARAAGFTVNSLIEMRDMSRVGMSFHGLPVIQPESVAARNALAIVGLHGNRTEMWARLAEHGWQACALVHPSASVSPSALVAAGAIIGPLAVVGARSAVGRNALLGRGSLVGHHVDLADGAVINPGANLGGNVKVGAGAVVGMGAVVVNGISIGDGATIAAGAVVVRDVRSHTRVQGVPAREFPQVEPETA